MNHRVCREGFDVAGLSFSLSLSLYVGVHTAKMQGGGSGCLSFSLSVGRPWGSLSLYLCWHFGHGNGDGGRSNDGDDYLGDQDWLHLLLVQLDDQLLLEM